MLEDQIPFEPIALLVFEDGSVRVDSIEGAAVDLTAYPGLLRAFAFMGAEIVLEEEEDDEPLDTEQ